MRIGVVTTSYPRHAGDHAGNFVAAQVDALRTLGHDVEVVGAHTLPAASVFASAGAPDVLEQGGLRAYLSAARFSLAQTRAVAARIATWDLVIAHWLAPSALAAIAAAPLSRIAGALRVRRPRLLAIAHGGDVHTLRRLRLLAPTLRALRAADARVVFVSSELRGIALDAAPSLRTWLETALVQPMGIDVTRFAQIRAERAERVERAERADRAERAPTSHDARGPSRRADVSDAAHPPMVLAVSRLVPVKGIDVAIEAMRLAHRDARLVVAGDGPERARLEALARGAPGARCERTATPSVRDGTSVELVGPVDADARDALLRDAACLVIPSRVLPNGRSEGTPMIALEALAAGVPVVASDVRGLRYLAGVVRVPPDDPPPLAAAVDHVLARRAADDAVDGGTGDVDAFDHRQITARLLAFSGGWDVCVRPQCEAGDSIGRRTA